MTNKIGLKTFNINTFPLSAHLAVGDYCGSSICFKCCKNKERLMSGANISVNIDTHKCYYDNRVRM